jgi:hypothetical protein
MRRSSLLVSFATIASLLVGSTAAHAEATPRIYSREQESPTPSWAIEIRFGPYRPDVDDGVGPVKATMAGGGTKTLDEGPYQHIFGDDRRFMVSGEFDWQALPIKHFGSLGIGGLIGYTSATGTAAFSDGTTGSGEDTSLSVWVFGALAVLRVDFLARDLGIPLVPYGKVGPAVAFWSCSNGRGTCTAADGTIGRGRTGGIVYAVGLQFLLDILDRQAAKTFAVERGVLHSYLFGEYTIMQLHGLGQSNAMYLGDKTWNIGLMFEL